MIGDCLVGLFKPSFFGDPPEPIAFSALAAAREMLDSSAGAWGRRERCVEHRCASSGSLMTELARPVSRDWGAIGRAASSPSTWRWRSRSGSAALGSGRSSKEQAARAHAVNF